MKRLRNLQSGFTIIELLIVIVVIAILAALVYNGYGNLQESARDTERRNDIQGIHTQMELFYAENGHYPYAADVSGLTTELPNLNEDLTVPPLASDTYAFSVTAEDGTDCSAAPENCAEYTLSTALETETDPFELNSLNGTPGTP